MRNDSKDATKNKPQQLTQGEQLANALAWILDKLSFDEIKLHGNVKWVIVHLVRVAILWVWSSKRLLVESANDAIEKTEEICGSFGDSFIGSYQVLTQALIKYGDAILNCVARRIHQLMEQTDKTTFRIGVWLVLAVDGSRLDTPPHAAQAVGSIRSTLRDEYRFRKYYTPSESQAENSYNCLIATERSHTVQRTNYPADPLRSCWDSLLFVRRKRGTKHAYQMPTML